MGNHGHGRACGQGTCRRNRTAVPIRTVLGAAIALLAVHAAPAQPARPSDPLADPARQWLQSLTFSDLISEVVGNDPLLFPDPLVAELLLRRATRLTDAETAAVLVQLLERPSFRSVDSGGFVELLLRDDLLVAGPDLFAAALALATENLDDAPGRVDSMLSAITRFLEQLLDAEPPTPRLVLPERALVAAASAASLAARRGGVSAHAAPPVAALFLEAARRTGSSAVSRALRSASADLLAGSR